MTQTIAFIGPAGCNSVELYSTAAGQRTTLVASRVLDPAEIDGTLYQPAVWTLDSAAVVLPNARLRIVLKAGTVEALTDFVTITGANGDFESEGISEAADVDLSTLETRDEANARQTALIGEHNATQTAVADSGSGADSDEIADAVVAKLGAGTATAVIAVGNVTGFPETLTIGDAYLTANGHQINLRLRDANDDPIVSYGTKLFSDDSFAPVVRMNRGSAASEVTANVTWVSGGDSHFVVELPATETAKAKADQDYTWQLILNWDDNTTSETTPVDDGVVRFVKKIAP